MRQCWNFVSVQASFMSHYTARINAVDTGMVVCHVMSRSTAVRVLVVSVRSYTNIIMTLTVILTSNPTFLMLLNRFSFILWATMHETSVCFKLWKLIDMEVYSCCAFPPFCTQKRCCCLQVCSWTGGGGGGTATAGGKINILNKKIS